MTDQASAAAPPPGSHQDVVAQHADQALIFDLSERRAISRRSPEGVSAVANGEIAAGILLYASQNDDDALPADSARLPRELASQRHPESDSTSDPQTVSP